MKRGTPDHPKTDHLADLLDIEPFSAVGLLELLWHYSGKYSPRGDIGRFPDKAIARALKWRKSPEALVRALVESHWLDEDPTHRLIVHDWPDHAEESVKKALDRSHQSFLEVYGKGEGVRRRRDGVATESSYAVATVSSSDRTTESSYARGMDRHGKERQGTEGQRREDLISAFPGFEKLWLTPCGCCGVTFPARNAAMAAQWWMTLVDRGEITGENLQEVYEGLVRYRASDSWHQNSGQWVPGMDKFLGYSKNGLPAAPLWKDRPTPYQAKKFGKY